MVGDVGAGRLVGLAELAHLRIRLEIGDELGAPQRAVMLTRIAELERLVGQKEVEIALLKNFLTGR